MKLLRYVHSPVGVLRIVAVDEATQQSLAIMNGLLHPEGVEIFGVMKQPLASRQDALDVEQAFCEEARRAGAKRVYSGCPAPLAAHYSQMYPGWTVRGPWADEQVPGLLLIEKLVEV